MTLEDKLAEIVARCKYAGDGTLLGVALEILDLEFRQFVVIGQSRSDELAPSLSFFTMHGHQGIGPALEAEVRRFVAER